MAKNNSLVGTVGRLLLSASVVTLALSTACVPREKAKRAHRPSNSSQALSPQAAAEMPPAPPAPPAHPVPPNKNTGNIYTDRFLDLWTDIHDLKNGYFSPEGIPYHSAETLIVEAPDYGHTTTSEAISYWVYLESMYGRITGDWSHLDRAWRTMEYYIIPTPADQPTNTAYSPTKPATYADERDTPEEYPVELKGSVSIGVDPLAKELKDAYGTNNIYAMHWLLDVDNWYGFGNRGDGTSHASYFNTFQRGVQESVWETIPQPSWEDFNWGGKNGYLDLFTSQKNFGHQWRYTNAPDADARAIQAMYWAKKWADEAGGSPVVNTLAPLAGKMGDYVRYSFFDKYFKKIGCQSTDCPAGTGYDSAHYLISWYFAWGGSNPGGPAWSWRIGSSHNHQGYQNPMAAYALSSEPSMRPKSPNGARDWGTSLTRQLEFYRWLQSSEGAIAGGATNSWKGRYMAPPSNLPTFYGMAYDWSPVFLDPPSNDWFGFQVWSLQRVAEYYYASGDPKAKVIMDGWVKWVKKHIHLKGDGSYEIPGVIKWSGQPAANWNEATQNFDPKDKGYNGTLHAEVLNYTPDPGTTAALIHTLVFYAAKAKDAETQRICKELLDRMWDKYRDDIGLTAKEERGDYKRFNDKIYGPAKWQGKMPNGDVIDSKSTFFSIRSQYKKDPSIGKVEAALKGGKPPEFSYHRFWAQSHIALAYATYGWLFPDKS